ncbi:hypothetical protein TNIN_3581 [Trichonephila inaurata madagascariensis]|uniref:Uncharacterized protein n=1 Tax=Trichonephila inaurata madagascariensis TaxID=2747483 RepID=A0A8X6WP89_9ARAC|nr:hypothetical protein TNIN_3581 [Trichonephila inaurata madagascariensis]
MEVNETQLALEYDMKEENILQKTVDELNQNIIDKNNEIQNFKSEEENVNYEKEIESLKLEYSNMQENVEANTLKNENIELKKELDNLKYDHQILNESLIELKQKQKNWFKKRVYPYKKNVESKRNEDEDELNKYLKENVELKSENKILHEKLEEKNQECIILEQQLPNISGMEKETQITVTLMKDLLKQLFAHYFVFKFDVLSEREIILNDIVKNYNEKLSKFHDQMINANNNEYFNILYEYVQEDLNIVVEKSVNVTEHDQYKNKDEFLRYCLNMAGKIVQSEASKINKKVRKVD